MAKEFEATVGRLSADQAVDDCAEPGQPCKVVTYRRFIATGGTPTTPCMAAAAAADPHAKEETVRMTKLDAFFRW